MIPQTDGPAPAPESIPPIGKKRKEVEGQAAAFKAATDKEAAKTKAGESELGNKIPEDFWEMMKRTLAMKMTEEMRKHAERYKKSLRGG